MTFWWSRWILSGYGQNLVENAKKGSMKLYREQAKITTLWDTPIYQSFFHFPGHR